MRAYPVISSHIIHIGYDERTAELLVHYSDDAWYVYCNVGVDVFGRILAAPSTGKALHALIRSDPQRYPYRRVTASSGAAPEGVLPNVLDVEIQETDELCSAE